MLLLIVLFDVSASALHFVSPKICCQKKTQKLEKYGFQSNAVEYVLIFSWIEPAKEHQHPTANIGHNSTIQTKERQTVLKHNLPVKKAKTST